MKSELLASVKNPDGNVSLYRDNEYNCYSVYATINGLYKSCSGLKEVTAMKRYNKYCNQLATIYINKCK